MTVKSKLFISYGILLIIFIIVSSISFSAIKRWNKTAVNLKNIQERSMDVQNLRSMMYRQITLGRDYIDDENVSAKRIIELGADVEIKIKELHKVPLIEEERNHVEALDETAVELAWILNGIILNKENKQKKFDKNKSRRRLSEIVDEVSDDIFVINKLYQNQISEYIDSSTKAGEKAVLLIASSVAVVVMLIVILFMLNQRWLLRPIESVNRITQKISEGNFRTRLEEVQKDEWGDLAKSINNMARSLQTYEIRYRNQERILALGEAAAYTAHNLQNPLAGIRAAIQYLRGKKEQDAELVEYFDDIIESIDRLNLWIKRFLDFAKPLPMTKEKINVNTIVEQALLAVKNKIESAQVAVFTGYREVPEIDADGILLEQVIAVFISNALEANSKNINLITKEEKDDDGFVRVIIVIEDDGCGISEKVKKKLFQAFVTTKAKGTGLGLAQAKKIIDLHYGVLTIESEENKGTKIIIKLPSKN